MRFERTIAVKILIIILIIIIAFVLLYSYNLYSLYINNIQTEVFRINTEISGFSYNINAILNEPAHTDNISFDLENAMKNLNAGISILNRLKINYFFRKETDELDKALTGFLNSQAAIITESRVLFEQLGNDGEYLDMIMEKGLFGTYYYYRSSGNTEGSAFFNLYKISEDFIGIFTTIEILNLKFKLINEKIERFERIYNLIFYIIIIIIMLSVIMTVFFLPSKFVNKLSGSIKNIEEYTGRLIKGDFSVRLSVSAFDEINDLMKNLNKIFSFDATLFQLKRSLMDLDESYKQITEEYNNAIDSIKIHTNNLANTSDSYKSINKNINDLAKKSKNTKFICLETKNTVKNNGKQIRNLLKEILELNEPALKIIDALKIINKITDETSLLTLNAAIEAGKAGNTGKGFRVVATEIGKLADISANATKDIAVFAEEIVSIIKEIMVKSEESIAALDTIDNSISEVVGLFDEIVAGSDSSLENSKKITQSINYINQLSEKNMSFTDEISSGNSELRVYIERLFVVLEKFKLNY